MGTEMTHYVLVGYYFEDPIPEFLDEETFEYFIDNFRDNTHSEKIKDGIVIIDDPMGNDYSFIGKILSKSSPEEGILPVTKCTYDYSDDQEEIMKFIQENIPINIFDKVSFSFGVWAFTHVH